MRNIVLGNEAVAQGAIDAGISGVYAYPGTPSTEITEYIQRQRDKKYLDIRANWSANEKTAMEAALGMSYAGKRALVVMKHVGLNVAMDAFMNMAISGINGGLVVVVADDPSMHSSQNEQDSRYLANFAKIPIVEPSNQQEAYDMIRHAFNLSEQLQLPVLLRLVTRLSHSRSLVTFNKPKKQKNISFLEDIKRFQLIPARAKPQFDKLVKKQKRIRTFSEESPFNKLVIGKDTSLGIIASGIAYNYLMENFQDGCVYSCLKISQYLLPKKQIKYLFDHCDRILVLEEGYPFIEEQLADFFEDDTKVIGRLSGHLNRTGELNPNLVAKALGIKQKKHPKIPNFVAGRPPQLCEGCGHIDTFNALDEIRKVIGDKQIFGDIGCYALGALSPHHTISTLIDMGASITMAKGAADAGVHPAIAIIGDSTFTHSGMTGLLDCINDKTPMTLIISDNSAVAMTGGQDSAALAKLKDICLGLGVAPEHLKIIEPLRKNHEENVAVIQKELDYKGVSVVIAQRACVRLPGERKKVIKEILAAQN
jgi:indolepyruvate ferredoxin oxidoreductase alpha subunit